jgi:hypothetical protein
MKASIDHCTTRRDASWSVVSEVIAALGADWCAEGRALQRHFVSIPYDRADEARGRMPQGAAEGGCELVRRGRCDDR